ncbi:helix-turn-helix domain-containing protein [Streptomyces cinnamoneus]|uniref:helix-turn-helix domain-containing protein n=1 Tax=Streptomyces cinnamoneus TaxID=53446 RepID=UPI0015E36A24|nr:helix-turn-helix transcriptional regulator [Streptomyces cinnamoneus]
MATPGAVVQRRQLRTELKKARAKSRLTQQEVAARMDWSPSKLIRIEAGQVGVTTNDLRALLETYGIVEPDQVDHFLELARASRKLPYGEYRGLISKTYMDLLSYEYSASIVRTYESLVIPGMLQTEEYARAVNMAYSPEITGERLDRLIELRLQRQELLEAPQRPELFFVLDEASIRRCIGSPGIMVAQLNRLKTLANLPGVCIQVIPFKAGAHRGMRGAFSHMEFEAELDDIVYLERYPGSQVTDEPEVTGQHLEVFWELEALAPPTDLPQLIDRAIEEMSDPVESPASTTDITES